MAGKQPSRSPEEVPGPGAYKSDSPLTKKTVSASFGVGKKFDNVIEKEKAQIPGPGNYSPQKKYHSGSYSFGGG
jgi:hypothetical protein